MKVRPAPQILQPPAAMAEADQPAGLPLRISAAAEQLDVALVRWEVAATARQRCVALTPERLDDLVLVVSELATNAIVHGNGGLINILVAVRGDGVSVQVFDGATTPPRLVDLDEGSEAGRGLRLVHELTGHRWGHRPTPAGKCVWAHVTYDPPQPAAHPRAA